MSESPEAMKAAIESRFEEAVTYPILTREIDSDLQSRATGSATNGGSLNRTAQQTLRDLLGWRYRSNDPAGFTAALSKAFTAKQVDGYVEWEWKPQSFSLQADLGAITGAQASIHAQARTAVDHVLPLLDALKPLRADVDAEDSEAIRNISRSALQEIVNELAARSGPRVQRVDGYFNGLLGRMHAPDAASVRGYLGQVRDRFGLLASRVSTVEEERNLTNFIVMVDQVVSLSVSWQSKRSYFTRSRSVLVEPFLGTQLVQLAEVLDVIVEQVHETYAGMDSVFFGPAERQTTSLRLVTGSVAGGKPVVLTVAELLSWVESFAAGEGRQLLQHGGKDGVVAFHDTLEPIAHLLDAAWKLSNEAQLPGKKPSTPSSFRSRRVSVLLEGLATHATNAVDLASNVRGPAEMPCWIRAWLDSEHCDARYVRTGQKPDTSHEGNATYVTIETGKDKILQAALRVCEPPSADRAHGTHTAQIMEESGKTRIRFDHGGIKSGRRFDLVLLTSSNKIIHIENAVELNQGVQPRIAEDGQGNKGGDNAPPKSTGRTKPPRK